MLPKKEIEKKLVKVFEDVAVFGFQGVSLLDYPGTVSSIVYTGYCNLTCPYCQNPSLLAPAKNSLEPMPAQYLVEEIIKRKKIIKGVVVTGGEPLMHHSICQLIEVFKNDFDLKVKIDTNGLFPDRLQEAFDKNLVDYVAMDFKTSPHKYPLLGEKSNEKEISDSLMRSLHIIKNSGKDYEIRITAAPEIVTQSDIELISKMVSGVKKVYIQQFVPDNSLSHDMKKLKPYSVENIRNFAAFFEEKTQVFIRGI